MFLLCFENREYRTLEGCLTLDQASKDPVSLMRSAPRITLDKAQRASELLLAVKREADQHRIPGRILLTGSADLNFTADLSRDGCLRLRGMNRWDRANSLRRASTLKHLPKAA